MNFNWDETAEREAKKRENKELKINLRKLVEDNEKKKKFEEQEKAKKAYFEHRQEFETHPQYQFHPAYAALVPLFHLYEPEKFEKAKAEYYSLLEESNKTEKNILANPGTNAQKANFHSYATTIVDGRVFNTLPIHLLSLTTMKILSRNDIRTLLQSDITNLTERYWRLEGEARDREIDEMLTEKISYAILSHRWLPKELTFQDMVSMKEECMGGGGGEDQIEMWRDHMLQHVKDVDEAVDKVFQFCQVAWERYDCKYVWFDTGCINKESSAELEESIRSMFKWYRDSEICIAYLRDTTSAFTMRKDPWFTRGWTLQELLAPKKIKIFGYGWQEITDAFNDKIDDVDLGVPLWKNISQITAIPVNELCSFIPGIRNVRQRIEWAYRRKTTRIEDMAYCLIGLFDIALSIAYGEGKMAFHRLQLEIMQRSDDKSLFVWEGAPSPYNTMFAAGPECFAPTKSSYPAEEAEEVSSFANETYALTNRGLRIRLPIYEAPEALQKIAPPLPDKLPAPLRIAILLDIDTSTSMVALLHRCNNYQHKRIATDSILTIKRPKEAKLEEIFVV